MRDATKTQKSWRPTTDRWLTQINNNKTIEERFATAVFESGCKSPTFTHRRWHLEQNGVFTFLGLVNVTVFFFSPRRKSACFMRGVRTVDIYDFRFALCYLNSTWTNLVMEFYEFIYIIYMYVFIYILISPLQLIHI